MIGEMCVYNLELRVHASVCMYAFACRRGLHILQIWSLRLKINKKTLQMTLKCLPMHVVGYILGQAMDHFVVTFIRLRRPLLPIFAYSCLSNFCFFVTSRVKPAL